MTDETVYEAAENRSRRGIATYLRRLAGAFRRGEPTPVDEEQTVTVDPPAEADLEVEVERADGVTQLELGMAWPEDEGDVDADAGKATFERYEDSAQEWRWRLVHDNGNIIADGGEGYASKQKLTQGIESVRDNAPGAMVVDESTDEQPEPDEGASDAAFELFEDSAEQWRWRLRHDNGRIIADSGQGYTRKHNAKKGLHSVTENVRGAPTEDVAE